MAWQFDIIAAQRRLAGINRYSGKIDGAFGPKSMAGLLSAIARDGAGQIASLAPALVDQLPKFAIVTPLRIAHFLAQGAVETGGFRRLEENLNYSAQRIRTVWPSRFAGAASARPFAHQPMALANKVYGGRLGNGPEASGDGWRYRGRGLFQLTGRANYRAAAAETGLGLEVMPGIAAEPVQSVEIACLFWRARGLAEAADANDLARVRKGVNGGAHGLDQARLYLGRALEILG